MEKKVLPFPTSREDHLALTRRLVRCDATDPVLAKAIREIARREERPIAYIGRKLLLRGLIGYNRDGTLGVLISCALLVTT